MVELNSKRLLESYLNYLAIKNMVSYVQKQTFSRNDDSFLNAIGFPYIGETKKDRKKFVDIKMDSLVDSTNEIIVLGLVADFEKIVFDRVKNASGEIAKIVGSKYQSNPFKKFSTEFVKTAGDIDKLAIVKSMVSPKLPKELSEKFAEVIDYRNRLAHGKRFGNDSVMSFDEIAQTLDDVLSNI